MGSNKIRINQVARIIFFNSKVLVFVSIIILSFSLKVFGQKPISQDLIESFDPLYATLLLESDLQKSLGLSDDQSKQIELLYSNYRKVFYDKLDLYVKNISNPETKNSLKNSDFIDSYNVPQKKVSGEMLSLLNSDQLNKFYPIYLQSRIKDDLTSAVLLKTLGDQIKLSKEQSEKIKEIQKSTYLKLNTLNDSTKKEISTINLSSKELVKDRRYAVIKFHKNKEAIKEFADESVLNVLSETQKSAIKAGMKIELTPNLLSGATPKEEKEDLGNGIKLEMVLIPAGKFVMGSPVWEKGRNDDENQHEVTLTKSFYMGKFEVTGEEWESVMGKNPSSKEGAKLPVTDVSWNNCQEFIKKLNAKTKGGYRLPTEAEWEYAARAGTTTAYSFGDTITLQDANYNPNFISFEETGNQYQQGKIKPVAVGRYKPNAFGLYDMQGNVCEWCEDWVGSYPKGSVTDPKGPDFGEMRMVRGGSWRSAAWCVRLADRHHSGPPDGRYDDVGFRLVREVSSETIATKPEEMNPKSQGAAKIIKREVEEKEDLVNGVKLEMVLVPAGKFVMGMGLRGLTKEAVEADDLKIGLLYKEAMKDGKILKELKEDVKEAMLSMALEELAESRRQQEVTLTKSFYMGKYEVTQEEWESVMGNNPSAEKDARLPVTNVSWNDCQEFIQKLNAKTKGGYRLPTEAEWEYACRGWDNKPVTFEQARLWNMIPLRSRDANWDNKPVTVGSYKPNAFGLYDMQGNVGEWCQDWYGRYPEAAVTDPKGPGSGEYRVLRKGESFFRRQKNWPDFFDNKDGFRLARDVGSETITTKPEEMNPKSQGAAKIIKREVEEKEDLVNGIKLEMVLIPAGKFVMGSPVGEKGRNDDENQHEVTLTKPFYMGKYEVTREEWEGVMGNNPNAKTGVRLPVTNVSWNDCQEFIQKLNAKTKGGYRLPTEAEWEYAGRARTTTKYSFGDSITPEDANYKSKNDKPVAVGSYKSNAFGLYDMQGNVNEWVADWSGRHPKGSVTDPKGPDFGETRMFRGGSWRSPAWCVRLADRDHFGPPDGPYYDTGFRLAREVDADLRKSPNIDIGKEFDPKDAVAYYDRGLAYYEQNKYDLAIADYTKAIELDPKYAKAYIWRGGAYNNQKNYDLALSDYNKAIELDPKYVNAYCSRGSSYEAQKNYDLALSDYNKAIELDPKHACAYTKRGIAYNRENKYDRAIADYTKAIELDPKYALAYYKRGNAYDDLKKYDLAIADFSKAIELDPNYADAYNNRGLAYKAIGKTTEANADFKTAEELKK